MQFVPLRRLQFVIVVVTQEVTTEAAFKSQADPVAHASQINLVGPPNQKLAAPVASAVMVISVGYSSKSPQSVE